MAKPNNNNYISNISSQKLLLSQIHSLLTNLKNLSTLTTLLMLISSQFALLLTQKPFNPIYHFLPASLLLLLITARTSLRALWAPPPLYLLDFSCLKPPNFCRVPTSTFLEHVSMLDFLNRESMSFMSKVLKHSGQGEMTYLPPAIHTIPPSSSHGEAAREARLALFPVFETLLSKTGLGPSEVDVLIVNCSGFCPEPSLTAAVVREYGLREDVKSFNLSGMGCSGSALAVAAAADVLRGGRRPGNAVVLSTEVLSTGWYPGRETGMMVLNCVFRWGAAGVVVTNRREAGRTAKYRLVCRVRSQTAWDDRGYYSAIREEDGEGLTGVTFRRDLLQVVGETLRSNISILGPKILPYTEILLYVYSIIKKKYIDKSTEIYVPNFKRSMQHFCLPASSKPLIQEIGKGLKLGEKDMEAALMTLHRFGNQSSSSLWYELAYIEAKEWVKKGDMVWQLGLGSGLKCTSLVWECIRPIVGEAQNGVWADSIDRYPVVGCGQKSS
ncbi:3-ketoacyl-CoA synthase [Striga asiatica]|uniref:3-ketoacyl-CoA synthase n=1 Tax=Striga asiatica TaxID=4170 RepID=A0A5A7PPZ5_STRAF|nr:3-ketoacyl-CoA synthase [Striga asiatica]